MRKIREVLRLKFESGLSDSQIARAIGSARSTVQECLRRAKVAEIGWPLPDALDEGELQAQLYQRAIPLPAYRCRTSLDCTPNLSAPASRVSYCGRRWQYSVFCDQYRRWLSSAHTLEIFYRGSLVAAHARCHRSGHFTTVADHRPERHRAIIDLTHERLQERAAAVGPATAEVMERGRRKRRHPEEALRTNLGILRLARDFSPEQLEAAARRALDLRVYSYRALRALIQTTAAVATRDGGQQSLALDHENVRGEKYFQ